MSEPNKDAIRKWVEALRSGRYKQARKALRICDSFCCLGVACELYRLETRSGRWLERDYGKAAFVTAGGATDESALPGEVAGWLFGNRNEALPSVYDRAGAKHVEIELAPANDGGMSFNQIADLIEREWLS